MEKPDHVSLLEPKLLHEIVQMRTQIRNELIAIKPFDDIEHKHLLDALEWAYLAL